MNIEATKSLLSAVAFSALAIKWAFDWKTDGWFGHGFTISCVIIAGISLAATMYEIASA